MFRAVIAVGDVPHKRHLLLVLDGVICDGDAFFGRLATCGDGVLVTVVGPVRYADGLKRDNGAASLRK